MKALLFVLAATLTVKCDAHSFNPDEMVLCPGFKDGGLRTNNHCYGTEACGDERCWCAEAMTLCGEALLTDQRHHDEDEAELVANYQALQEEGHDEDEEGHEEGHEEGEEGHEEGHEEGEEGSVQTNPAIVECGQSYLYHSTHPKWAPTLTLATAQMVTLHTCDAPGNTMDTRIFDGDIVNDESICSNDDHGDQGNSVTHQCSENDSFCRNQVPAGTYTLSVGSFQHEEGTATLTVECGPAQILAPVQANPASVQCGLSYKYTISASEPRWAPTLTLGCTKWWYDTCLSAQMVTLHTCDAPGTTMDTSIFNGGGSSICSNDDHETWLDHGCNRDSSYCQNQVSAGTYTLEVGSFNDEPGTAILTVECVDANVHNDDEGFYHFFGPLTNPTSVECGQTYTFSTSTAEPRWEPTLALGTAKAVALHTCKTPGNAMDTHIFNDGGNSICSNDDHSVLTGSSSLSSAIGGCNDHDSYCSNQVTAGTYTLSIGSYDDLQTGTAMLTVECADVQTNPEVVECGQSYTYTISTGEPKWEPKLTIATAQKVTLHTVSGLQV
jgi:hypothetical protein